MGEAGEETSAEIYREKGKQKPCRACVDFQSWAKIKGGQFKKKETDKTNTAVAVTDPVRVMRPECPVDREELGRNTWSFLHTMAAYYPDKPSEQQKTEMKHFMTIFGNFFPCDYCAEDFRENMKINPADTTSQHTFSQWLCRMHNHVNKRTGKAEFDCAKVNERWRDGWRDGSCD